MRDNPTHLHSHPLTEGPEKACLALSVLCRYLAALLIAGLFLQARALPCAEGATEGEDQVQGSRGGAGEPYEYPPLEEIGGIFIGCARITKKRGRLFFLTLQGSDPGTYEMIQKIHTLQRKLIQKTEEVITEEIRDSDNNIPHNNSALFFCR